MRHGNFCIARVDYLDSGTVHLRGADLIHRKGDAAKMDPEPYRLKRSQFKWEREIRLLFVPDDPDTAIDRRPPLKLDWSRIINQVVLDPRCVTSRPEQIEREVTAPGFTCTIEESDLGRRISVQLRLPDSPKESGLNHATERHREPERVHP
jgi:hypothetical protein